MNHQDHRAGLNRMLFFISAGMELSWLLAAAVLVLNLAGIPLLYLTQSFAAFILAALLTVFAGRNSWMMLYRLALHFIAAAVLLLSALDNVSGYYRSTAPGPRGSIEGVFTGPQTNPEGLGWALVILTLIIFYACGISLARRSLSYRNVTVRFDIGITAFIVLFIIAGAAGVPVLPTLSLLFAFFIFSLPAVAMARYRQSGTGNTFIYKYRSSGPVLLFTAFVLTAGSGIALLFYPFMLQAARTGQEVLGQYGKPLAELFARMILFVFSPRSRTADLPPESITGTESLDSLSPGNGQAGFLENLLFWAVIILAAVATLTALYFGFRYLIKWLLSGRDKAGKRNLFNPAAALLEVLKIIAFALKKSALRWKAAMRRRSRLPGEGVASYLFRRLLTWGAKSGRPRFKTETPVEYAGSLKRLFPSLENEIDLITDSFNREIYGGLKSKPEDDKRLYRAWRRLLHPAFWPERFKLRLAGPGAR